MSKGVGVPIRLLHEAAGHVCTVELTSGETYRGDLAETEDNWNVQLKNVTATAKDGHVSHMEHVFIRGARVKLLIIPDMLKNSPMFKRTEPGAKSKSWATGTGRGRGRAGGGRGGGGGAGRGRGRG